MSAPPPSPPPGLGPDVRRRIHRRTDGHLLGGVASGIADHLRIDPVLVRVAFVVLGLWPFPGFGVLLYVALLFLLPAAAAVPGAARRPEPRQRGLAFYAGVALLVVAVLALLGTGGAFVAASQAGGPASLLVPLLLIGIGVALWVSDRGEPAPAGTSPPTWGATPPTTPPPSVAEASPAPSTAGATGVEGGTDEVAAADAPASGWTAAPPSGAPQPDTADRQRSEPWQQPDTAWQRSETWGSPDVPARWSATDTAAWEPAPPRPWSPLGRITLGVALTVAATLWALRIVGVAPALRPSVILAATLATVGLGLLVGSVAGRARWLAWLAAPLAAALLVTAALEDLELPLDAGVGDRIVLVGDQASGVVVERLGAGRLVVDLTDLDPAALGVDAIDVRLGAGEVEVVVPEGVRLTGRARLEVGQFDVRGEGPWRSSGGIAVDEAIDVGVADGTVIAADIRVGAGQITVRDVPAPPATEGASR